jgi:hypothetical protein
VKRIVSLAILFVAVVEFVMERTRLDLWMMTVAVVMLLWGVVGRALSTLATWEKHNHNLSTPRK